MKERSLHDSGCMCSSCGARGGARRSFDREDELDDREGELQPLARGLGAGLDWLRSICRHRLCTGDRLLTDQPKELLSERGGQRLDACG